MSTLSIHSPEKPGRAPRPPSRHCSSTVSGLRVGLNMDLGRKSGILRFDPSAIYCIAIYQRLTRAAASFALKQEFPTKIFRLQPENAVLGIKQACSTGPLKSEVQHTRILSIRLPGTTNRRFRTRARFENPYAGARLMLYVSSEITGVGVGAAAPGQKKQETAFRFAR